MLIGTIIVTYNPEPDLLRKVVDSLTPQVTEILLVDNGSNQSLPLDSQESKLSTIYLHENTGIAKATNVGIEYFQKKSFDFVLTSDQDTLYEKDYIAQFLKGMFNIKDQNHVAAYVPNCYDILSQRYFDVTLKGLLFTKRRPSPETPMNVYQAIASGMIINLNAIPIVGTMMESLFIDCVDLEWCWRVNHLNYRVVFLPKMVINHRLGDSVIHVRKKAITQHSPVRNYYQARNFAYLALHSKSIGFFVRIQFLNIGIRVVAKSFLLMSPHLKNLHYTLLGFFDGLRGRMGKHQFS